MEVQGPLLTDESRAMALQSLFDGRLKAPGDIFIPSTVLYDEIGTDDGVLMAARQVYRWLGVKPRQLTAGYRRSTEGSANGIYIDPEWREYPYQAMCLIALAVLSDCIRNRLAFDCDDAFIAYASVETGLGIIILNGMYPPDPWYVHTFHILHRNVHGHAGISLRDYRQQDYAMAVNAYLHRSHVREPIWSQGLTPQALRWLGRKRTAKWTEAAVVRRERTRAKQFFATFVLCTWAVALIVATGVFVINQRPYEPSAPVVDQYEKVMVLQRAYDVCARAAQAKQDTMRQDDIFADMDTNSTLLRCQSLRNQYNYEVAVYNSLVDTR